MWVNKAAIVQIARIIAVLSGGKVQKKMYLSNIGNNINTGIINNSDERQVYPSILCQKMRVNRHGI